MPNVEVGLPCFLNGPLRRRTGGLAPAFYTSWQQARGDRSCGSLAFGSSTTTLLCPDSSQKC